MNIPNNHDLVQKRGMLWAASAIILAPVLYTLKNDIENTVLISTAL
jgi:hypothetical protein